MVMMMLLLLKILLQRLGQMRPLREQRAPCGQQAAQARCAKPRARFG
jgi:hypothetical protein